MASTSTGPIAAVFSPPASVHASSLPPQLVALSPLDLFSGASVSRFRSLTCVVKPLVPRSSSRTRRILCTDNEYVFPDPIPEFAEWETERFGTYLLDRLSEKEYIFEDDVDEVVEICTKIMSDFLHTEYGGPGTLLVLPFIDMADAISESGLPGGPLAARAAVVWAQKHVDLDWKEWTGDDNKS